uniref:Ig-like domain-containing protein n=1 Tax=Stegastes partitus TaxID=144197 RepID=A0A3B5A2C4_9TELE
MSRFFFVTPPVKVTELQSVSGLLHSLSFPGVHVVQVLSGLEHSLTYYLTTSSGLQTFPEFVGVSMVDNVPVGYCDSNKRAVEPRQDWVNKFFDTEPQNFQWHVQTCLDDYQESKAVTEDFKKHFNHTTGIVDVYWYVLVLFLHSLHITSTVSKHLNIIKHRQTQYRNMDMINDFWSTEVNLPSVSLLQKTASSPVTCHATGFYPDRADLFWTKDGEELHEDVDKGEILPNHDGSFQMSVDLNISSIMKSEGCVLVPISPSGFPAGAVIGVVVVLLLLALCITGLFIWRKRYKGTQQHKNSCPAFTFKADIYKNISSKL